MTHIKILETLHNSGYEGYIVGGAVRDKIMGLTPKDIDIATNAKPLEVINLFPKVVPSGIKFGTVTVFVDDEGYEVTTFRADGKYLDGRRPEEVFFSETISDDLSRRDFTINALAEDLNGEIIDIFGGVSDINNKIIKAVGNPKERFKEDALRMLRAFRFSARYGFEIEPVTLEAIKELKEETKLVSGDRIREEITQILMTDNVFKTFSLMYEVGILQIILPEVANLYGVEQNHPYHKYNVFEHTMRAVENSFKSPIIRWTMLLHDIGKPVVRETVDGIDRFHKHNIHSIVLAEDILKRLRFSNSFIEEVFELILYHDSQIEPNPRAVRRFKSKLKIIQLETLLKVKEADIKAQNPELLDRLDILVEILKISELEPPITVKDLALNGYDIMNLGYQRKDVGLILNTLLELVLGNPELNTKETLLKFAQKKRPV